eukprot:scaffold2155_cov162-Amphora_coffeaeformis.AAC.4
MVSFKSRSSRATSNLQPSLSSDLDGAMPTTSGKYDFLSLAPSILSIAVLYRRFFFDSTKIYCYENESQRIYSYNNNPTVPARLVATPTYCCRYHSLSGADGHNSWSKVYI